MSTATDLQIFDCPQNSDAWYAARMGIPTASETDTICVTKGRGPGGVSLTRQKYLRNLAAEVITGKPVETWSGGAMQRGKDNEKGDLALYSLQNDVELVTVGFMRRGDFGCSPDALVGTDGMVESKSKAPHLMIEILETKEIPSEHYPQLWGQLLVSQREWVDWIATWSGLPQFRERVYRNEREIAAVKVAVDKFNEELAALVARLRGML